MEIAQSADTMAYSRSASRYRLLYVQFVIVEGAKIDVPAEAVSKRHIVSTCYQSLKVMLLK